jgi:hypothetical protein
VRSRDWLTFPGALRPTSSGARRRHGAGGRTVRDRRRLPDERARALAVVGDTVELESGTLRSSASDGRRIDRIRFTPALDRRTDA